jgi:Glycosyltransferases involved in cell wall biogenesis
MTVRHAFVVPAYGQSPYLDACLASLAAQRRPSRIHVATSTPYDGLDALCARHGASLNVHAPNLGIGRDWNMALRQSDADWITVAHQDDLYDPGFSESVMTLVAGSGDCGFVFTDAREVDEAGAVRGASMNQRVKRLLAGSAFLGRRQIRGSLARRILLGFGNPVSCPAVTINMRLHPDFVFREDLRTNMDWMAWVDLSRTAGIARIREKMMSHRVHGASETARCLDDGARRREDKMVFAEMWPRAISVPLQRLYALSYRGYLP